MEKAYYIIEQTIKFERRDFEDFLIQLIAEDKLYNLRNLTGTTIEKSVRHHPLRLAKEIGLNVEYIDPHKKELTVNDRLADISKLCSYRLYNLADNKVDKLYEEYTQGKTILTDNQVEWMFNLIDKISIALYC